VKEGRMPLSLLSLYKETFIGSAGCLEEIGKKLVAYAEREEKFLSLLMFDLDDLRGINRDFGYEKGNEILLVLADSIEDSLRKSDVAGKYEADSFLVILPNTDVAGALKVEERTRKTFERKINELKDNSDNIEFKQKDITFKTAIASFPEHGDTFEEVLQSASLCLKEVDKSKKVQVAICPAVKRYKFNIGITDLVKAMEDKRLFPVFQKIIDFKTNDVYGYEVLMRMKTETGEIIPAYSFIDLVYSSNMIYAFEEYVIDIAVKKLKEHNKRSKLFINMPLRVLNVFRKDKKRIERVLKDMLDSQDVIFEITERKEKQPLSHVGQLANELKSLGFSIALDDFGTEHSSFEKLNTIHPDIVKLDRFFLREGKDMLAWVAEGLKSLNYKILLEGVETKEDVDLVERIKPDFIQGFYYGRPSPEL